MVLPTSCPQNSLYKLSNIHILFLKRLIIIFLLLAAQKAGAQVLAGRWDGGFWSGGIEYSMSLNFDINPDSTYRITSITKVNTKEKVVCSVVYKIVLPDSVYLEETAIIEPANANPEMCLQKLSLRFYKTRVMLELSGTSSNTSELCGPGGKMVFRKNNDNRSKNKRLTLSW